jgi:hypothetical protein
MGLEKTGRIARVVIHPSNPDIVYAAALGHSYGPQPDRGIYRTVDGGKTWERVLFVDENTGASDIVMDPSNPRILFAGMWQLEIHVGTHERGPGGGIFMSVMAGRPGSGSPAAVCPQPRWQIGLAIARTNPNHLCAHRDR